MANPLEFDEVSDALGLNNPAIAYILGLLVVGGLAPRFPVFTY